jgi:hypothetical protein
MSFAAWLYAVAGQVSVRSQRSPKDTGDMREPA